MLHHPLVAAGFGWWAMLGVVVNLDAGTLILGLAPTLAVAANYHFSKRQRNEIRKEATAAVKRAEETAGRAEGKAVEAVAVAASSVAETKQTLGEVQTLVNGHADEMTRQLAARDARIASLEDQLARIQPPAAAATAPHE
jgi:hypothetical protein